MLYIMPYKLGSKGAKELADGLNSLRVTGEKSLRRQSLVINWGNQTTDPYSKWDDVVVINKRYAVINAANKIKTFTTLTKYGINTVPWTTHKDYAAKWLASGDTVMARTLVSSSQGKGIHVVSNNQALPLCPLYTKYISKCHEYRVHVAFGNVIDVTKKKRREDGIQNEFIRNYDNGWVFCREDILIPDKIKQASIDSVKVLGLDFGAVDILYKQLTDSYYVLEVNSAPGLEGTTLQKYIDIFKRISYVY